MNRPLFLKTLSTPSYYIGKVGLRTYQHPLIRSRTTTDYWTGRSNSKRRSAHEVRGWGGGGGEEEEEEQEEKEEEEDTQRNFDLLRSAP